MYCLGLELRREKPVFLAAGQGAPSRVYSLCFGSALSITEIYSGIYGGKPNTGRASATVNELLSLGFLEKTAGAKKWPKYSATMLPLFQEFDSRQIPLSAAEKQQVASLFLCTPSAPGQPNGKSGAAKAGEQAQPEGPNPPAAAAGSEVPEPGAFGPLAAATSPGSSGVQPAQAQTAAFKSFRESLPSFFPVPETQARFFSCLLFFAAPFLTNSERSLSKPLVNRGLKAIRARLEAEKPESLASFAPLPIIAAALALEDRTRALEGAAADGLFLSKIARFCFGPPASEAFAEELRQSR